MATVRDILTDAMVELGVLDPTETIDSANATTGLRVLNRMLGQWNTQNLLTGTVNRHVFTLAPGQQTRTLGVGGNFNTTTAVLNKHIHSASVMVGDTESSVQILTDQEWEELGSKNQSGGFPTAMWPSGSAPLNTLYFVPIPASSDQVVLYLEGQFAPYTGINQQAVFQTGAEHAVVTNLALLLAPQFQVQPNPVTVAEAAKSLAMLKRANWQPSYRTSDPVLMRRHF